MKCERVAMTMTTIARITEKSNGDGDDADWLRVMRMMQESVSSLFNQKKVGRLGRWGDD